jgi:hypothetical protein
MVLQTGEMPGATGLIRKPLQQMWGMTAVWTLFLTWPAVRCAGSQGGTWQASPRVLDCTVIGIGITDLSRSTTVQ